MSFKQFYAWVESKMQGGFFVCEICDKKLQRSKMKVIIYFTGPPKVACGTCAAEAKKEKDVLRIVHKTSYKK